MNYRTNPKNGDKLSILGFGCMRFSESLAGSFGFGKSFDSQKAENLIKTAIDKGVNYFDTAYVYSGSEEILGMTLAKYDLREQVFVATKMPLMLCRSKSDFDKFFNRQLERLQTDYIDYYLLHMLADTNEWNKLCEWGIESWIQEKKALGQINQIGFSYHGSRDDFLLLLDAYDWDFVQIQYNYSDENYQAGVTGLKKAASKGIAVMIMEPLLGGQLVTGLPQEAVSRFKKANPDISPVAWALRWVWNQAEVTLLLSGMNDMKHLDENVRIAETALPNMLSKEEIDTFHDVKKIFNDSFKIHCTGCHYCMPCPYGVNIPACFSAYNTYSSISKNTGAMQYMMSTMLSDKPAYASICTKCGVCEMHCPQHIKIRTSLLENTGFKLMRFGAKLAKLFMRRR